MKKRFAMIGAMALCGAITLSVGTISNAGSYTVVKGDSLWKIAKEKLGDGARYTEIFEANRDKIKNPNKIQIGQVLEIPDGVPTAAPAVTPEAGAAPAPATPSPTPISAAFDEAFLSQMSSLIETYNTMKVGDSNTETVEGAVSTVTKIAENLLMTENDVTLDSALNSNVKTFLYKTENGYQVVLFFTGKNGVDTYSVYNVSADGKDSSLLYFGIDSNDPDGKVEISDYISGGNGYIEFVADTEGVISDKIGKFIHMYDAEGNPTVNGYVARKTEGNTSFTFATLEDIEGNSIIVNYSAEAGDTLKHKVEVSMGEESGVLSFATDANGEIVADSVSFVAGAAIN